MFLQSTLGINATRCKVNIFISILFTPGYGWYSRNKDVFTNLISMRSHTFYFALIYLWDTYPVRLLYLILSHPDPFEMIVTDSPFFKLPIFL